MRSLPHELFQNEKYLMDYFQNWDLVTRRHGKDAQKISKRFNNYLRNYDGSRV